MRYLLVSHVPLARDTERVYRGGDMFLEDLRAQTRVLRQVGFQVTLACPLRESLSEATSGSFATAPFEPAEEGLTIAPLPAFLSLRELAGAWSPLRRRLRELLGACDVAQMDYGGHPAMLGELAWHACPREGGPRRVWVFDGADPFARWELHARQQRGPLRRLAWQAEVRRRVGFLRGVVREADAVFAHNRAVQERFCAEWSPSCRLLQRSFVTERLLVGPGELARRLVRLERDPVLRVAVAGRQIRIKGTDHVLQAVARARAAGARIELEVWGDGDDLPAFRALAGELGLGEAARFRGAVPYGPELFAGLDEAHLLAVTNLTPELSRNVLLALARGLPLVSYSNPATDELLEADDAALLVPAGDPEALAAGLVRAWRERALLCGLAERGRDLAARHTLEGQHRLRARVAARLGGRAT